MFAVSAIAVLESIAIVLGIWLIARRSWSAWKVYRENVATMKDIDCDPPHWLFGHMKVIRSDQTTFDRYCSLIKKFPKCQPVWVGPFFVYLQGYYPDFVKTLLSSDEPKDDFAYRFLRPWIGDGLLTSHGAKWKRNRRLLTPAFHFDILKTYLACTNQATTELMDVWSEKLQSNSNFIEVEMFSDISRMALDNIVRCIFSKRSGCQRDKNNDYLQAVKCLSETAMKRVFNPFYYSDFLFYLTPTGRRYKKALKIAHDYTANVIDERQSASSIEEESNRYIDFLDILIKAKDTDGKGLSRQEICDEVDTFVFEGHDTVTSGISWAMFNLATYPDLQDKCRLEVNETLTGKLEVEWQDLSKLKYLTMFIKESMRIYPPVYAVGRQASQPICFPRGFGKDLFNCSPESPPHGVAKDCSKTFPKGSSFAATIQYLHCNPHVWNNPFVFDPERFSPENSAKRSPFAYVPFSAGSRNCIGQNFAMNEMKVVLARTLATFKIHLNKEKPRPERQPYIILRSATGIHVILERIRPANSK